MSKRVRDRRGDEPSRRNRPGGFRPALEMLEERCLLSADMVLQWNQHALDAVKNDYNVGQQPDEGGPTRTSRALAIVQAAIYDAADAVIPMYTPYLVHAHAQPGTSVDAAVAQAAHDTLVALYPQQTATFDAELAASLQGIPPVMAMKGEQLGQYVASQILADRQNDGSNINPTYTPGIYPGQWRPDPLHPSQTALGPGWGYVTPFAVQSGAQFQVPPPPALTSQEYTHGFNQVKSLGGDGINTPTKRTAEQTIIGNFWAYDGSPQVGTPPREYNQILEIIATDQGNTLIQNARLFALANMAMADAAISAWFTKYTYNFWRPVAGIRESDPGTGPTGLGDGNPHTHGDVNWTPLGAPMDNGSPNGPNFTPPFPAYTSGHATIGKAMFETVADFYGTDNITFSWMSDEYNGITVDQYGSVRPAITRTYHSLSQAAYENAQSRLYLGIHWPWDRDDGIMQGQEVADYTIQHVLLPLDGPSLNDPVVLSVLAGRTAPLPHATGSVLTQTPYAPARQVSRAAPDGNTLGVLTPTGRGMSRHTASQAHRDAAGSVGGSLSERLDFRLPE